MINTKNIDLKKKFNLVKFIAGKFRRVYGKKHDFEDLVSAGLYGLALALNDYNPSRGDFDPYCSYMITFKIMDYIRFDASQLTRRAHTTLNKKDRLERQLQRPLTQQEIKEQLGVTTQKLCEYDTAKGIDSPMSLQRTFLKSPGRKQRPSATPGEFSPR